MIRRSIFVLGSNGKLKISRLKKENRILYNLMSSLSKKASVHQLPLVITSIQSIKLIAES